ncbi:MAG: zeta toxin family protein [Flavobacteriales bacterium]
MAKRIPRIRIIAGPNGSGKSTLIGQLRLRAEARKSRFSLGQFLNADDLLIQVNEFGYLDFTQYKLNPKNRAWEQFLRRQNSILRLSKKAVRLSKLKIQNNRIAFGSLKIDAYIASFLVEFLRNQLLKARMDFSFETVFSHPSKIDLITRAKKLGYRVYVYYVATDSPLVNIARVKSRSLKGGHDVKRSKIIERYYASLALLPRYILDVNRAYIWDNSNALKLIAEITEGDTLEYHETIIPQWVYNLISPLDHIRKS